MRAATYAICNASRMKDFFGPLNATRSISSAFGSTAVDASGGGSSLKRSSGVHSRASAIRCTSSGFLAAIPDYLIKLKAPGENAVAINTKGQVSRENWIQWAECCWMDIRETHTLNVSEGRGEDDTKHICPLQLDVIDRCVRLYSNPDEIVFSPFTGIGSEGYVSVRLDRRFYGCELKPEYYRAARMNLSRAESEVVRQDALFA